MPTEFASDNVDFEDLFDPDIKGDGPQATWLENNGVPLRFAALAYGTKRADVGYDDGGIDVSNLWAAKGTAKYFASSIFAHSHTYVGGTRSAGIGFAIKTNGTIVVTCTGTTNNGGGGTYNYAPTTAGASAAHDFRIFGTVIGVRNNATSATITGKGGINYSAGLPPNGSTVALDTGWIATADDAANFLTLSCSSPSNLGASSLDFQNFGSGTLLTIQVRRKSDGVLVFNSSTQVQCLSDSQS